jgi:hypothetical protein
MDIDDHDEDSMDLILANNSGEDLHATVNVSDTDLNVGFPKGSSFFPFKSKGGT